MQRFRPGDRVVASCVTSCGTCALCGLGEPQLCSTYGAPLNILFGCQSEAFVVRSADVNLARIPDGMHDRQAILAADIMSTGFAAIERARIDSEFEDRARFARMTPEERLALANAAGSMR